ncbi:MAG TPA: S-layer homology domain-containing protein [Candidatus Oscillibacter avistercoris]|nr:S-layer homology domain-containing protein [Candidatus Oscillibacter avistercoris]
MTAIILNDDPTPLTPDGALEILAQGAVQVTCTNSDAGHGSRTSGLISGTFDVGNYEYTNSGYVTTITVYPADYVDAFEINNGENIDHGTATPTSQTITLIYTDNREWTVTSTTPVGFSVTCDDEDEDDNFAMQNVYVYAKPIGSGTDGALTEAEEEILKETYGLTLNAKGYCVLGKLENVLLPLASQQDIGQNYYSNYDDVIQAAFAADKFKLHESAADHQDLIKTLDWYHLGVASGADGYENEAPSSGLCWHLDGNLNISAKYKLTYDANGGTIDGSEKHIVNDITTKDPENYTLDTTINPEHADEGTKDVLFAGWTTDVDATGKIYRVEDAKNGSVPAAVDTVDLTVTKTVYALWSYDEDNDGTPDINEIIVTPADITIYTGGSDYEGGIVDEDGNKLAGSDSNGFPEPGFYITLPTALNDQLRGGATGPVDLSEELSFVYEKELGSEAKHWTLKMYNPDTDAESNIAYEKFIYQLEPGDDQDPVRLLITDAAGKEQPSDRFGFDVDTLYQEYTMTIYGGGNVETNEVQAVIEDDTYSVFVDTGDLTVRGVKGEDSTSAVVTEKPEELDKITAVAADDVTYYINDSAIPVRKDAEIHLLADELADTPQALTAAAEKAINGAIVDPEYDFMYLDLVDSSNGNAYVTLNKDGEADGEADTVTIHWPIPDDADPDGKFYVVHFDGLDRDYDVDTELEGLLTDENITVYEKDGTNDLTVSEDGKSVSFETSTFSPFALVYEQKDGTTPVTKYTVTYDANGGKGAMASQTVNAGNSVTIKANTFTRSDHTFTGWNTRADGTGTGYAAGNTITPNSNLTLYAQWKSTGDSGYDPKEATLRFNSRGGTEFEDEVRDNPFRYNPYNKIPTRPGYRFTGWYDSSRLDDRYDEDEEISVPMGITTVWAGWEETSVPSMLNGDDHYAYIQGYSDGTVRPNANITRAQVATIFFRLLDEDVRDDNLTTYNTFPDVDEDYWANTAISTMASLGVINGRNSGLFDPDAYITRAEFAAICARFDDSGVDGITTFTDTVGHWAEDEISRAAALGWIQGYSDGTFRPNQYITRAQAVTMINRVLCRLPEDTDDLLSGMNTWTDCHEDDWFYLAIQEATNSHDFVAKDRVYESWTDLNRAPDWSRYE